MRTTRTIALLRTAVITVAATAAMVLGVSAAANAAWNDSAPIGAGTITTGSLGIDPTTISGGTWTKDGNAFDPSTAKLTAGTTLVYTVPDVSVTAVGNNLEASFKQSVTGAVVPDAVEDHVTIALASTPATIKGSESGTDGKQTVALKLTVTADSSLPTAATSIDLSNLTVTLQNTYKGWTDTATLNGGTLTTGAAGGQVAFDFDLGLDPDRTICLFLTEPDATIHWSDWSQGPEATTRATTTGKYCHSYPAELTGQAYVTVDGTFKGLGSPDQTVADIGALKGVNLWTDAIRTTSAAYAFYNAVNMTYINGAPSSITDMSFMFANASTATSQELSVNGLVTSNVTSMRHMFERAGTINWWSIINASPQWDTSKVVDMSGMFMNSTIGSYNLAFNTSSVQDMSSMFEGTAFNGNINSTGGRWDVSQVTDMSSMFKNASTFNGDITGWNTAAVRTMASMFEGATNFNGNIGGWSHTGEVTDMSRMFMNADAFNQDLPNWKTSSVTDMSYMFAETASFKGDVRPWDLSSVTTMAHMFENSHYDYYSLGLAGTDPYWNVSNVRDMSFMFAGSTYNKSLAGWNTSSVTTMSSMFEGATAFNSNIGGWSQTGAVTTMDRMFYGASSFNRNLSGWDVTSVTSHTDFAGGMSTAWSNDPALQPQWSSLRSAKAAGTPSTAPTTPAADPTDTPSSAPTTTPDPTPTTPSDDASEPTDTDDTADVPTDGTETDETPDTCPTAEPTDSPTEDPAADAATGTDTTTTTTDDCADSVTEDDPAPTSAPSSAEPPTEAAREEGTK
ncbi:BspA family leucine-rich repeat surface protein [Luteimicrobium sp. NPDC057192]|uniref:BspA family leucine-rich repeat surface protein n=1 Tax=Luteimicrobium sp. NPDC057192 TaxID=3346042 RepID=UPI0036330660